jgi:glycosyltransferase involved in cell wall biosynthesis
MERQKKIWLINKHAVPVYLNGTHIRTVKLAEYFSKMGYDVTIFGSSTIHNRNMDLIDDSRYYKEQVYDDIKFVHIKTKKYNNNNLKRIYSFIEFSVKMLLIKKKYDKPDIIIHTSNIPFDFLIYFLARNLKSKYIVEVLDLWPESFVAFGIIKKNNPLLKLFYWIEKWLYTKADNVVFSLEGGSQYIKDKGWDIESGGSIDLEKIHYINNGVDIKEFNFNINNYKIEDKNLEDSSKIKIIYLGSIRLVNNLKQLIDVAAILKKDKRIVFLIYGDGIDRQYLEDYCLLNNIDNVIFKDKWISPQYVPYVLSKGDVNILNYRPNSIEKYGGSQNKLFLSLASGKPICCNINMGYSIVNKHNLGITKNFNNSQEYADALLSIVNLDTASYADMCRRSKQVAQQFDYELLAKMYTFIFEK